MGVNHNPQHATRIGLRLGRYAACREASALPKAAVAMVGAMFVSTALHAAETSSADFADLSLEQLSNIEVTSVSRQPERLSDAPASIFVITGEDIRRSGARSLPEALRLAPNLQVARTSANTYAISARGFNNSLGNKLLVLIDGRTVYTPLFSGVFWDAQDVMLEDVERIEVISGPGATLWGANAVNGVINVITRSARDTQGGLVALGGGNQDSAGAFRYGTKLESGGYARFYGNFLGRGTTQHADGSSVHDASDLGQVGFRADWSGAGGGFTLQGDAYNSVSDANAFGTTTLAGANLLARWNKKLSNSSEVTLQAYYDHTERSQPAVFADTMDIFDVELQHAFALGTMHKIVWGGGYRYAHDRVDNDLLVAFIPARKDLSWANVFAEDQIQLTRNVALTIGAKVETNVYTGAEFLPTLRLAWKPADNHLLWTAASRAVRAPARIDREFFFPGTPPFLINGGPDFESEVANVFEIGYRGQLANAFSYSITAFHTIWDKLRSGQPAPAVVQNMIHGTTDGIEAWASYQLTRSWRMSGGVSTVTKDLELRPGSTDPTGPSALGNDPRAQWMVRSLLNLTDKHEIDITFRHVSALPDPAVPEYTTVDLRFGWRPRPDLELSLTVNNVFEPSHAEFDAAAARSEYERNWFLKLLWRF